MSRYLGRFPIIGTQSLEEAHDAVTRIYMPHELRAKSETMDMTFNAVTDRHLTLGYLTYQTLAELAMPPTEDCYIVNLTVNGETRADRTDGDREVTVPDERGVVLSPVQTNTVRWSDDAEQIHLKVARSSLESHLSGLLGHQVTEVVDFDFGLDLTTGAGRSLIRSVRFLANELDRPEGLADMPLAREQLESYVLTALLYAGHHQFTDALTEGADTLKLGRVAPVVRYIETHADECLTPESLARVGYMSVRTLHAAFQYALGESPMAYVRRIRLSKVRAELLRSDPETVRVSDIAVRWGFYHQSRFAQQYREQFNELPSSTLRG
jgi:AraC-like DNA-binding protein